MLNANDFSKLSGTSTFVVKFQLPENEKPNFDFYDNTLGKNNYYPVKVQGLPNFWIFYTFNHKSKEILEIFKASSSKDRAKIEVQCENSTLKITSHSFDQFKLS